MPGGNIVLGGNAVDPANISEAMPISSGAGSGAGTAEFCAHCGQAIPEGRKFCGHCGSPVPGAGSGDQGPATAAAPPPPPAPNPVKVRRRLSRRTVILLSVLGTLVVAVAVGAFFFLNALRGGADSPEQAVEKALEALSNEDLVGAFSMVSPHERDAVVRVQDALVKKAEEIDIAGAAGKVAPKDSGEGGSELVFDGIDVSFSGIEPFVTQVSDDVAVVRISSGQIRVNTDPAKTKGALRSVLDNVPDAKATEQTIEIRDLGPSQSGLSLMATKTDGRWFVNLSMSALEAVNNAEGSARGFVAKPGETGSDSPAEAAKGLVQALPSQMPASVAPFLAKEEANAMYLYGHLWNQYAGSSSSNFSFGNVDFTDGPRDGSRAQAYVNQISVSTGSRDRFTISDKCMSNGSSNQDATCLTGSAYKPSSYGMGSVDWMSALLSQDGKFALTTVEESGKWKVSVLDTVADHAVGAINGLTKEQALAMTNLAQSQDSSGSLTLGESATVEFNNAGYAVKALKLEKPMRLALDKNSEAGRVILYSENDKTKQFSVYSGGSEEVPAPAGDYKVVVWAGSDFSEAFARDGNAARGSAPVGISEYVEPPSVDGRSYSYGNYVSSSSFSSSDDTFTVKAPSAPASLRVAITSSNSKGVVATIDGKSYTIGGAEANSKSIPVPQGTHQLKIRAATDASSSGSSYSSSYAYFDLSFDNQ